MKVNFSIGQNNFLNVHQINQSIARHNGNGTSGQHLRVEHKDRVTISPQGRKHSFLESLIKQKANITEQKNSLIHSTLEKGGSLETIKSQLENYDDQMKNLEEQIATLMAKEMEKQTEQLKKQEGSKPKTEEEVQNERLAEVVTLSADLQQTKRISSVQSRLEGDARVLKSEIKLDNMRTDSSSGTKGMTRKEARLADLEQRASGVASKVFNRLSDIVEDIEGNSRPHEVLPDNETKSKAEEIDPMDKPSADIVINEESQEVSDDKTVSE